MGELAAVLFGAVLVASFVALWLYVALGLAATVSTLRAAHRDRRITEEIDRVIAAVLGPRSPETLAVEFSARRVRRPPVQ
ncbi:MAG TPA: hypothetical protein VND83_03900 [Acidimicrobiales bacterium]|nr:hypothetical protein [Acidimicrobiales bacterium]